MNTFSGHEFNVLFMNTYEIVVLFKNDLAQSESLPTDLSSVNELLQKHGGSILSQDDWGTRNLSFRIKKQTDGRFFLLTVTLPAESVTKINSALKLIPGVLRYQIVTYKAISKATASTQTATTTDKTQETVSAPVATAKPAQLSEEDIDKTIEKMLEDKVV